MRVFKPFDVNNQQILINIEQTIWNLVLLLIKFMTEMMLKAEHELYKKL